MKHSRQIPCLVLSALVLAGAGHAIAGTRSARLAAPEADGGSCQDALPSAPTKPATPPAKPAAKSTSHSEATGIRPVIGVRGGGDDTGATHTPRWHSFLPGMFR